MSTQMENNATPRESKHMLIAVLGYWLVGVGLWAWFYRTYLTSGLSVGRIVAAICTGFAWPALIVLAWVATQSIDPTWVSRRWRLKRETAPGGQWHAS
jgi:hypothetical protein